jgi:DNA-binding NtrC family response regulator
MQVLVVDSDLTVREAVRQTLRADGFDVSVAADAGSALEVSRRQPFDLVFFDVKAGGFDALRILREEMQPDADFILMTGHASIESALEAVRGGARDYIVKPFSSAEISGLARTAAERRRIVLEAAAAPADQAPEFADLIGSSAQMAEVLRTVSRIAMTDLPVLISGETGTGKEVIARSIHAASPRAARPFIAVSCGSLTETLLETELFGHVKGAFVGAIADRRGLFEEADGGTLLLDEVTETSPSFQSKLLGVLQDHTLRRVGSDAPRRVNVRVLATTNRDVEALVALELFQEELLYRLNVISLRVPPLRERSADIDLMVQAFLTRYRPRGRGNLRVAPEAMERLRSYSWPGNVRELRHVMQRLAATKGNIVRLGDLPERIRHTYGDLDELVTEMPAQDVVGEAWASGPPVGERAASAPFEPQPGSSLQEADRGWLQLAEIERRYLLRVLYHTRGNKKRAAEILGVDRKTLSRMVERYAVNVGRIKRDVRGLR